MFILDIIFGLVTTGLIIAVLALICAAIFAFISYTKIGAVLFMLFVAFKLVSFFKVLAEVGKELRTDIIGKIKGE